MKNKRPALFRGRHFQDEIIVLCLRWYLRYSLSYRDLEVMMAERALSLDHSTIARWVLRYAPILSQRIRCEMRKPWQAGGCTCIGRSIRRHAMTRLHARGLIEDPVKKAKSVVLTETGLTEAERLFKTLFVKK